MASRSPGSNLSPTVHVPSGDADQPSWTKVGVIAAIGFMLGVAWPRLAGVRLGPSVPSIASTPAVAGPSPAAPSTAPEPVPASAATPAGATSVASAPPSSLPTPGRSDVADAVGVAVAHGVISSCKTAEGDSAKASDCGTLPGLDAIVIPRLRKLASCPAAAGANGKLRLTLRLDFGRGSLAVESGRGRDLATADGLVGCARTELGTPAVAGIPHDKQRYVVNYAVDFHANDPPAAGPAPSGANAAAPDVRDSTAQVAWDVAVVRDAPKTGKVVARLQRGATLRVGPVSDGWYPVKYGDNYENDGWVYRGAIGR